MTDAPSPLFSTVAVIGAGPAGLMAAERLATARLRVTVHERMPSVGRKFLLAGRGGLNLTHSEALEPFLDRYGPARDRVAAWLTAFSPADLTAWAEGLGQETFVGSSGRVFPKTMKASPLLRAWLARLEGLGVEIRTRSRWTGWKDGALAFDTPEGERLERPDAVVLALGGASWARMGSDAAWVPELETAGVAVAPFQPSNVGFDVAWSPLLRDRFAGQPVKGVALSHAGRTVRGEAMIAAYGVEGGGVYALSAGLREAIARDGKAELTLDLRPDISRQALTQKLLKPRGKDSLSNWLRKIVHLDPAAIALLREDGPLPTEPGPLAARIKGVSLTLTGAQGLSRAISSAGGVTLDAVDDRLMLKARPGVFLAGEMLDWEAPTGGYLLQAAFASGVMAATGVGVWLQTR
ncbi:MULTISPECIES: TIGR03862 family flavoprotein [unclassified Brevundimonas]|uniref:TIGR03862 family flavoprotein n=1 Tax=unclassified Brevundimonas TaxID=2622653 RepID=UPI000CFAB325|nr:MULTISPECIES: TIGR03862 family flavoprotein [unclassified Brevundimonas]PRA34904.1 aminoacetone oxidase family FAD-binding enzyme [Brevundimonas sp. MYb27]PQZ83468.1 aminoacetone oxidase family FAD-binding enzyme [Brevundimonas sp. MYb31]PRB14257.1 aminoacetone oxidase family FAD-binding enzyme [Brevundimonas sp. MYb52]PRB35497.1 aminoacetone oxidase family FAD-binding enzyme [Brevundimonas sp. MYb46]PRB54587.1 aminoacetone oxidase family FAD-binding enzyme [Brevundimonas sp. MYb33]